MAHRLFIPLAIIHVFCFLCEEPANFVDVTVNVMAYPNGSCQSESTFLGYIICGTETHSILVHVVYKGTKVDLYVMSIEVN